MMELLAPAGSFDGLKAAVAAGADAVYIGGGRFGARAYADNPDQELLLRGIDFCHIRGRSVYLTVNTLLKERELSEQLYEFLLPYYREGLDGVIVQDFGVVSFIREHFPNLLVHGSTQMTITGVDGARFLQKIGVCRVVTARELSLEEVRGIIDATGMETEVFVHGAMCYSYSGQCLLSSMIGGRSGNRGRCAQPCRLPYTLLRDGRPCSERQQYLMSLKDLCAIDLLPELAEAGVASLKIEGRMKKPEYAAGVVRVYRKYLDRLEAGERWKQVREEDRRELLDLYSRGGFSQGYFHMANGPEMMTMKRPNHLGSKAARLNSKKASGKTVCAGALCTLAKGDVLEAVPDAPGQKGPEVTVRTEIGRGAAFDLPASFQKLPRGTVLYRTRNELLLNTLHAQYVQKECKEKIKGNLIVSPQKPVILKVSCGSVEVTARGETAQPALRRPLSEEELLRQIGKTGDSPFFFEDLSVKMEGEVFLPLQALNQLRREALSRLEQELLEQYRRREARKSSLGSFADEYRESHRESGQMRLAVSVQEKRQLEALILWLEETEEASGHRSGKLDTVYLDAALLFPLGMQEDDFIRAAGWIAQVQSLDVRCMIQMPPVFREKDRFFYKSEKVRGILSAADGFLVRTADMLAFLQDGGYRQEIVGDDGLYAYNREAARFWRSMGVSRLTLPSELNVSELAVLEPDRCEMILYGRTMLMVTAQCLKKNTVGCNRRPEWLELGDRKQVRFPVRTRCRECCNVIYNSVPLDLLSCREELKRLAPAFVRLAFTDESGEETAHVLKRYDRLCQGCADLPGREPGTRGHFRRGVE